MRFRSIRCGDKDPRKSLPKISSDEVACLQGFWSLEEQLGIRKRPQDNVLHSIPKVELDQSEGNDG